MTWFRTIAVLITIVGVLATPSAAQPEADGIDLRSEADVVIGGSRGGDQLGVAISSAGDVNGDGLEDIIVGARYADNRNGKNAGTAYVVFGGHGARFDARNPPRHALKIVGAASGDGAGSAVSGVGDVNGDGLDDVMVGASSRDGAGKNSGSAYVVFGRSTVGRVNLKSLREGGYRIDGAAEWDLLGNALAGLGDVNGDGLDDVLVGAMGVENNGREGAGTAYLVFGRKSERRIRLDGTGWGGYRIDGAKDDGAGFAVASAGDVNGDGVSDLIVGAPFGDHAGRGSHSGSAYVVFGDTDRDHRVDLANLGIDGFRIDGAHGRACSYCSGIETGISVAGIGDVNRDGLDDVAVGAWLDWNNDRIDSGSAYIVYGRVGTTPVDLASLGSEGFRVDGARPYFGTANEISSLDDVSGDGVPDFLVGALGASYKGRPGAGIVYVLSGETRSANVDLARFADAQGYRIGGAHALDGAGSEASAADFNGDGTTDIIVGSPYARFKNRREAGAVYVVYGGSGS